jgi:hypothetical protein
VDDHVSEVLADGFVVSEVDHCPGGDVTLQDTVGLDQVLEHLNARGPWNGVVFPFVFLDEESQRQQVFRLIGRTVAAAIAQPVERCNRVLVFRFGPDNP